MGLSRYKLTWASQYWLRRFPPMQQTLREPAQLLSTRFSRNGRQITATAIDFFKWALEKGQKQANELDYVPLPDSLVKQIETYWRTQFVGLKS